MASSSSPMKDDEKPRNWAELPPELMSSILLRLGTIDILENAQKVCKPWQRITQDPSMWRKIDMQNMGVDRLFSCDFDSMCRHAVDRSDGGLVEIKIGFFGTNELLKYIADRSSNLRSLGVVLGLCHGSITNEGLVNVVAKLPLLAELETSHTWSKLNLKAIGHSCPQLKTLKLNSSVYMDAHIINYDDSDDNEDALAIAESMPKLCYLQLIRNRLTNTGLNAILDNCPHLEHLDLRKCFNVNIVGGLEKRCLERIKDLRHPDDSTADCPFDITFGKD